MNWLQIDEADGIILYLMISLGYIIVSVVHVNRVSGCLCAHTHSHIHTHTQIASVVPIIIASIHFCFFYKTCMLRL